VQRSPRLDPRRQRATPSRTAKSASTDGRPRLLERYRGEMVPQLMKEFNYSNTMQVPRLVKIVLNIGLGEALTNQNAMESARKDLMAITGQRPVITKARKSIANFKLRAGQSIGQMVTLRGYRMYEFFDRLVNAALPRIRDFRGLSQESFDQGANYSFGLRELIMFPEIDYNTVDKMRGFQMTFVTTARSKDESRRLLQLLGMPFSR